MAASPQRVVVLSGAGLSAPSGVPTFRGAGGLWDGHRVEDVASPDAWAVAPAVVRRFYDERRLALEGIQPNDGHRALVRLQRAWGPENVALVTQNIDGLLTLAGAPEVVEMHGAIRNLRCEADLAHPRVPVAGEQDPAVRCAVCDAALRPDIVWFGERPFHLDDIARKLATCAVFVSVGTSGVVYPAAGFVKIARHFGARCVEVNPDPVGGPFDEVRAESADTALPRLVDELLA
jgi:NAD-dependent deacetylase